MSNIRKLRERASLSAQEVAIAMNVTVATVSRWENGKFLPRGAKLPDLARVLHCTVDELLEEEK